MTAHTARHSYCTNWIAELGDGEVALQKLSHQVGCSIGRLRATYIHHALSPEDFEMVRKFGADRSSA